MTGATLFSGIGAPEVAVPDIDWRWCAEIEPFPSAVLAARHGAPNLGDVTAADFITRAQAFGPLDLLVAGWPCQDLSVAGLRHGLAGNRSGLFFRLMDILRALRPMWIVLENVPGLLSSNSGSDFACVLDALDEERYVLEVDILDAQYFGLAQRRERIFFACQTIESLLRQKTVTSALTTAQCVVETSEFILRVHCNQYGVEPENSGAIADAVDGLKKRMRLFGMEDPASWPRLLASLSVLYPASAPERQGLGCKGEKLGSMSIATEERSSGLSAAKEDPIVGLSTNIAKPWQVAVEEFFCLLRSFTTSTPTRRITISEIYICSQVALSIAERIVRLNPSCPTYWSAASSTLTALLEFTNYARSAVNNLFTEVEWVQPWCDFIREAVPTESALRSIGGVACADEVLSIPEGLRRNSPPSREAWKGVAPTLEGRAGRSGANNFATSGGLAVAGTLSARTKGGGGLGTDFDLGGGLIPEVCPTLRAGGNRTGGDRPPGTDVDTCESLIPEIAYALNAHPSRRYDAQSNETFIAAPLTSKPYADHESQESKLVIADTLRSHPRPGSNSLGNLTIAHALRADRFDASEDGTGRGTPLVAVPIPILEVHGGSSSRGEGPNGIGIMGDPCHPLAESAHPPAVAFMVEQNNMASTPNLPSLRSAETPNYAVAFNLRGRDGGAMPEPAEIASLRAATGGSSRSYAADSKMGVRRLTPTECEILQGFLTGYTAITYRGKPAADGPRYKSLGNSMAVPCVRWILGRIQEMVHGLPS